jgi:hypothetical protein
MKKHPILLLSIHRCLLITALAVLIGLMLPWRAIYGQSSSDPLVLAFYYTWFDENTWTYDQLSDLPAEPYVSRDRAVMGRHIDQAKSAGIDALLVAWYGPGGGNQTETNLAAMLEEATVLRPGKISAVRLIQIMPVFGFLKALIQLI